MADTIVLATRNKGKIAELALLLAPYNLTVLGLDAFPDVEEVEETGTTFEENALLKARAVAAATGHVAIADDSGIEADALDKRPGVYSARYSDDTPDLPGNTRDARNNAKILRELADVEDARRTGRFCCVMAAATPDGRSIVAYGKWEGMIARAPEGDNGFGYDPLFIDLATGMRAAVMTKEAKNQCSHRGKALRRLMELWPDFWAAR